MLAGGQPAASAQNGSPPKTYNVAIKGFKFVPEKLEVNAGDTIVWKNEDIVPHIVAADKFKSKSMDTGESWTFKTKQKGDFPYICRFHPTMKGELIVH
jgi:plastocyanin